jgi:hypothetical protein
MEKVIKLKTNLENLLRNFSQHIVDSYSETEAEAIDMNVSQMYDKGVRSDGTLIGEYSPATINIKTMKGQKTDFVTLRDTESFHDNMKFKTITEEYAEIYSTDSKNDMLTEEWGSDIFGLTDENKQEYKQHWFAAFFDRFKKYFQL